MWGWLAGWACGRWGRGWRPSSLPRAGGRGLGAPESALPQPPRPGVPSPSPRCLRALQPFPQFGPCDGCFHPDSPFYSQNPRVTLRDEAFRNKTRTERRGKVGGAELHFRTPLGEAAALRLGEHPQVRSGGTEMERPQHPPQVGQQDSGPLCHSVEPTPRASLPTRAGRGAMPVQEPRSKHQAVGVGAGPTGSAWVWLPGVRH